IRRRIMTKVLIWVGGRGAGKASLMQAIALGEPEPIQPYQEFCAVNPRAYYLPKEPEDWQGRGKRKKPKIK
ncbi:hypothetical protein, partial [Acinetobacter baumannii]|uniref:hypothetical protein n=1 Tax=Acinetobacter baumannii TaxID=470 RepID=UPI003462EE0A